MKKVVRCICMMAVIALAFTSCKKDEEKNQGASSIQCSTEEFIEVGEGDAKVYISGTRFIFEANDDEVELFNVNNTDPSSCAAATYHATTTGANVMFALNDGQVAVPTAREDAFYVFYPAGNNTSVDFANGNKADFRLDPVQQYRAGKVPAGALYMAAKSTAANLGNVNFNFKTMCGVLSMKFWNAQGKTITKIRITDKHFNLTGVVQLSLPELDPEEMTAMFNNYDESNDTYMNELALYKQRIGYNVTNAGNTLTLDLGAGVALGKTRAQASQFYVVLRPLALSQGCIVEVFDGTNWQTVIDSNNNNCMRQIGRAHV